MASALWIAAGLVFLVLEVASERALVFLFPGVAAILVGLLTLLHVTHGGLARWTSFVALSVGGLVSLRRRLLARLHPDGLRAVDSMPTRRRW